MARNDLANPLRHLKEVEKSWINISCTYTCTEAERFVLENIGEITIGAGFPGHGLTFASLGMSKTPREFQLAEHLES